MAYNKNNFLLRVKEINEIYLEYSRKGCFTEYIYNTYIKDRYHISRTTFYTYLTIPYERQLKKIQEQRAMQPTLF
jgi:hypothetical protein